VTEVGRVNRISVAVLVDGAYVKNEKGEMVYGTWQGQLDASQHWSVRRRLRPEARRRSRW
jgi:hypothetical protein